MKNNRLMKRVAAVQFVSVKKMFTRSSFNLALICAMVVMMMASCNDRSLESGIKPGAASLRGTWRLLNGTLIEKGDTTVTDYTKNVSFIKIINDSHFSFLQHDLTKGKDSGAVFVAGGGRYSLTD